MRRILAVVAVMFAATLLAAPVPKALKKKPASPDGAWYLVEHIWEGKSQDLNSMDRNWAIDGEELLLGAKSQSDRSRYVSVIPFKIVNPAKPTVRKFGKRWSVIEVDGDTMRFCYAEDMKQELTECKPGPGVPYYVYKRVKEEK